MNDPFRIVGPAVISVSGGRTSAYMLRRILDAHDGVLPPDVHAVFANTGKEMPETLDFVRDCSARWGVPVAWVEYDGRDTKTAYREVTHATASRDGEPLALLIRQKRYLPNHMTRFCTESTKVRRLRAFMRCKGCETWTDAVGLRYDEPRRVARIKTRNDAGDDEVTVALPLHEAKVTRADVMAFWSTQPFDLALPWYMSNCGGCFLKGSSILERIERDRPGTLQWWADREAEVGGTFNPRPPNYATIAKRARLPMLPMDLSPAADDVESVACACTD